VVEVKNRIDLINVGLANVYYSPAIAVDDFVFGVFVSAGLCEFSGYFFIFSFDIIDDDCVPLFSLFD
jgi:hypothetical protein